MMPIRIFMSSVQREFTSERRLLCDYVHDDPLMRRFFEVFLFEDVPASDRRPDDVYLDEVERCEIYVGLFGIDYGAEDVDGVSPTEREFDRATEKDKHRLIFLKDSAGRDRHPKMHALIDRAQSGLVRGSFARSSELRAGLYAALVQYLETRQLLRFDPFDFACCSGATLDDLDVEGMYRFIRVARRSRQFPLPEETPPADLLRHLNLLNRGRLTNAAVLLFGRTPQRFLISSEVKCAHFHGTEVTKPIPSYQVYKGTVFDLVDQAVDFVMSKIALSVGTRAETAQAPTAYELPKDVVTEAIVNAVAHRDYTDNSSVQVMLFADRLEVVNSGQLPPALTVEKLRLPHQSLPANPLIAESMYLLRYIEKMGTGTVDMVRRCAEAGLPEPEFEASAGFTTRIWRPTGISHLVVPGMTTRETAQETGVTTQERGDETDPMSTGERIIALLRSNPTMTGTDLAGHIGITPEGIKYHLERLRKAGRLRHVGPTKKGHWEILRSEERDPTTQETGMTTQEATQETSGTAQETGMTTQEATQETGGTAQETGMTTREATQETGMTTQERGDEKDPMSTEERIIALLQSTPTMTRTDLAGRIGITPAGIKYHLDRLRKAGHLRRVGPTKKGHWEVLRSRERDPPS